MQPHSGIEPHVEPGITLPSVLSKPARSLKTWGSHKTKNTFWKIEPLALLCRRHGIFCIAIVVSTTNCVYVSDQFNSKKGESHIQRKYYLNVLNKAQNYERNGWNLRFSDSSQIPIRNLRCLQIYSKTRISTVVQYSIFDERRILGNLLFFSQNYNCYQCLLRWPMWHLKVSYSKETLGWWCNTNDILVVE